MVQTVDISSEATWKKGLTWWVLVLHPRAFLLNQHKSIIYVESAGEPHQPTSLSGAVD